MSKYFLNQKTVFQLLQTIGNVETPDTTEIRVLEKDFEGNVLRATGTTVPTNGEAGFAKGCEFIDTDVAAGTSGLYINNGDTTACEFTVVESNTGDIEAVLADNGLVGGGLSGSVTLSQGLEIYNNTGGDLLAGQIVSISSFDGVNGVTVENADSSLGVRGTHVVTDTISDGTSGNVYEVATVTDLNTAAQNIGDPVYLDAAGGYTFVEKITPFEFNQLIGVVKVADAAVGEIVFFPGYHLINRFFGLMFQDATIPESKITDSSGIGEKAIQKSAIVVYDFAVDGGAQGTITLNGAPEIPDNAVVNVESYDVVTTLTSATDAATVKLELPTDGDLFSAIAISDVSNPWDEGVFVNGLGAVAIPTPKKCTAARIPQLVVAGGEDLTAGKIVFQLSYWVSA